MNLQLCLKKVSTALFATLVAVTALNALAMGKPDKPGGGKPGGGDGGSGETQPCQEVSELPAGGDIVTNCLEDGVYAKAWRVDENVDTSDGVEVSEATAFGDTFVPNLELQTALGLTPDQIKSPAEAEQGWKLVLDEEFDTPATNSDYSGTVNFLRHSTKFPFSTDAKFNTVPGEDSHWNVNTTGRYPGEGIGLSNFYNNSSQTAFLDTLFGSEPGYPVFETVAGDTNRDANAKALQITAYRNPAPIRKINRAKPYLSGLISSAANPVNNTPHGNEFRYGYIESRVRLPLEGNGMRAALWLYSDNAFFNQQSSANNEPFEIDILEYLPNTIAGEGYKIQPTLFGGVNNTSRPDNQKIMTYDTIFMTYHYNSFSGRTPTDWTVNSEDRYRTRRGTAFNCLGTDPVPTELPCRENFEFSPSEEWITVGLLWQPDYIEWYLNDTLVHRVVEEGNDISGFQHVAPVFDKRMYIIANLSMGLGVFEGAVDDSLFESLPDGSGESFAIDYIKVWQDDSANSSHVHCGYDAEDDDGNPVACDTTLGIQ